MRYIEPSLADCQDHTTTAEWMWQSLRKAGYVTLKTEDMCWQHSGLLRALGFHPGHNITSHSFLEFFCSPHYKRPHCIGDRYVHDYMFDYTQRFISHYSQTESPWAAFLNFGEAHEDSMTLAGILDDPLSKFFREFFENPPKRPTVVTLLSDHGLHYGPAFQTARGQRNHKSPLFWWLLPPQLSHVTSEQWSNLEANQEQVTTPLDTHMTLMELLQLPSKSKAGQSLLTPLPVKRTCKEANVPSQFCLDDPKMLATPQYCLPSPLMPSPLTYYSDGSFPIVDGCEALLNFSVWHSDGRVEINCNRFESTEFFSSDGSLRNYLREYDLGPVRDEGEFVFARCRGWSRNRMQLHLDLKPSKSRLEELKSSQNGKVLPNVYVIGIDATSRENSFRHLRMYRQLLKGLSEHSKEPLSRSYRSFSFERFNSIGFNSVPNQGGLLSGCATRDVSGESLFINPPVNISEVKEIMTPYRKFYQLLCSNEQLESTSDIWLFDFFRKTHTSLYMEEICSKSSIYTTYNFIKDKKFIDHIYGDHLCPKGVGYIKYCIGSQALHEHTLDYFLQFVQKYKDVPRLAVMDLLATHEIPASDLLNRLKRLDAPLTDTIRTVLEMEQEAVIFVMGDHGMHRGWYVYTDVGQMEHKQPLLDVIVSKSLLDRFDGVEENLRTNKDRLTTVFDLYTTLRQISTGNLRQHPKGVPPWGHSLFEQIPFGRTCEEAKIPRKYCSCDYAETDWDCGYDNEAGCDCSTFSCPGRSNQTLPVPIHHL